VPKVGRLRPDAVDIECADLEGLAHSIEGRGSYRGSGGGGGQAPDGERDMIPNVPTPTILPSSQSSVNVFKLVGTDKNVVPDSAVALHHSVNLQDASFAGWSSEGQI
jgi:hypothetical protein